MEVKNVIMSKDIEVGSSNLLTAKDIFFTLETPSLPNKTAFCLLVSLQTKEDERNKMVPFVIKILSPKKDKELMLFNNKLKITNEENILMHLKGVVTFIETGKHVVYIEIDGDVKFKEPILNIIKKEIVLGALRTPPGLITSTSATTSGDLVI